MGKIFIGGLNATVEEMDIAILVSLHGTIKEIKIVRDKKTKKSKGYAFLEIPNPSDIDNIIAKLDGEKFQGNFITVKKSD